MTRIAPVVAGLFVLLSGVRSPAAVERWGLWETTLSGPRDGNPYLDVRLTATFIQGDRRVTVQGFWDGEGDYRLRFSPPAEGEWRYLTSSNRPELDGRTGSFTAVAPAAGNRGPVEVFKTHHVRYAAGTPCHPFGTTCYAWTHQPEALQEQTLKTLASSPFNKIRFCVFPKSYTYNQNEPERFAFVRQADGTFDFTRPDPAFWRHFEGRILDLQRLGIQADLILWHPYDRWGFSEMGAPNDDRYLRYCIARLGAFRNVWWSLANEYDLMAPGAMKNHRGDKSMADWDRFFRILQAEDAHDRLRSIHNCRAFYDYTRPWVSHAGIQSSDMRKGADFRRQFGKPVIYDECKYEGNVPQGWGNLSAQEMTRRFWFGTLAGCYVGHGETYMHPEDILWWAKGGALRGESPARIRWMKDFMAGAPPFHEMQPLGRGTGFYHLAKPGAYHLLYAPSTQPIDLRLPGERPYKVDRVDPWGMTVTPIGTHPAGVTAFKPAHGDMVYRFVPYPDGERPRPVAAFMTSVTEGPAPLQVRFLAPAGLRAHWDFGDGSTSGEPEPRHVFLKPGVYTVTLTVTDARGESAQAVREITVDGSPDAPLVRVGFADGEIHGLKLNGSAKRTRAGGLHFPVSPPWGWAEGPAPEAIRGLRSFTLMGWLRPESLQTGSGGNRILFCLNRDRDGIDLVCHADGRLRLAVNQWPDKISNDSSPGRLVPGKWTFFAVAYDGTRDRDNVRWYVSPPADTPDPAAGLTHDRTVTYAAGPVGADIGPLAIGNFNATLRGAGLDRQFRGEIRNLQLFGSRTANLGALGSSAIERTLRGDSPAIAPPMAGTAPAARPAPPRPRVIVSTDIGGSDPDDFQSMVHYLVYADRFDTEGLIASPPKAGRKEHILEVLDAYAKDHPKLARRSPGFPSPDALRAVTKQGATDPSPAAGWSTPTEGSQWIIERARADDPRPLWILVWGSITDVAQALHDDPGIVKKLRVYSIGSWNTRMDPAARDYVVTHHPGLWLIESDSTFRGMYVGGRQDGDLGNVEFVARHVWGHGALGELFFKKKKDIKMGDTPSVLYLLHGPPDDPAAEHWGGAFVRRDTGPNHWTDNPDPDLAESQGQRIHPGARTVNRWREEYLRDWQRRMQWLAEAAGDR